MPKKTPGRPGKDIVLSESEKQHLLSLCHRRKTAQALVLRAKIILELAKGTNGKQTAAKLGVSEPTVGKWRNRFHEHRVEGLADAPRPGAPRTISDAKVGQVITDTLESTPKDATHWSTRSMAEAAGISHDSVRRIWSAFGLKPHLTETFRLSTDPFFVQKVRDVVGLYLTPH